MEAAKIYLCLGDPTRLRILHLVSSGELCVCHLVEVLEEPQVKISRHLAYLRRHRLVSVRKEGNWRHYSLAKPVSPHLRAALDCIASDRDFRPETTKLTRLRRKIPCGPTCC